MPRKALLRVTESLGSPEGVDFPAAAATAPPLSGNGGGGDKGGALATVADAALRQAPAEPRPVFIWRGAAKRRDSRCDKPLPATAALFLRGISIRLGRRAPAKLCRALLMTWNHGAAYRSSTSVAVRTLIVRVAALLSRGG